MDYEILIGGRRLGLLDSVTIRRSVESLCDTATIVVPATYLNHTLNLEQYLKEGEFVDISLGYNGNLKTEFQGYLKSVQTDDKSITIECEDALYLWRVDMPDEQLQNITLTALLQRTAAQVNSARKTTCRVDCDYQFTYKAFTISHATAYDVLKKIQDETKANIWFDGDTLHIHAPYSRMSGKVVNYDFAANVQSAELKYVRAKDKKIKVKVETTLPNGNKIEKEAGTSTGTEQTLTRKVSAASEADLQALANNWYNLLCYDGYEGSLTGWLVPYCEPTCQVRIKDSDSPKKEGVYYVTATEVSFSRNGGTRKITLGRKTG